MAQPINYMAQFPQDDFIGSIQKGLQLGATFRQLQEQQAAKQQADQRLQAYRTELESAYGAGTPKAFEKLITMFPEHQAALKPAYEALSQDARKNELSSATNVRAALETGNTAYAKQLIERQIKAAENTGQDASNYKSLLEQMDVNPKMAAANIDYTISSILGPKEYKDWAEGIAKVKETVRAEEMAPITRRKETALTAEAEEKARQAAIKSRFAESDAAADLEKKGWDIRKIQADMEIAKQNAQIAAANVQMGKTTNDLKRQELEIKLEEMKQKRDATVREKVADVESARLNIDNMLNTSQRVLNNPKLNSVIGTIQGRLPVVLSDESQDAVALIETLGSQAFLSQIPNIKGMGQLSNEEGKKLQNAFQNLGRVQSEKQFRENLDEAKRLLMKARQNIATRSGIPESAPDIPAAKGGATQPTGGFAVTAPNGQTYSFPNQQAAEKFKQAAGIR